MYIILRSGGIQGGKTKMRLTEKQKAVLLALTNGWQTPAQIAQKVAANAGVGVSYRASYVNQPLKALMREGLAEKKPDTRGQYRLTPFGAYTKGKVAHETQR
jgi:predicted transcriptional regulator